MNQANNKAKRLLEDIFAVQDEEISCDEAAILMARNAVDLYTDDEARQLYPALWRHFHFCPNCAAEYDLLMDLARQEGREGWIQPAQIPPRPADDPKARRSEGDRRRRYQTQRHSRPPWSSWITTVCRRKST